MLLRIDDQDKHTYYIEESCKNNWGARQLERQVNSQLYERLLLSSDKEKVLTIAKHQAQRGVVFIDLLKNEEHQASERRSTFRKQLTNNTKPQRGEVSIEIKEI